MWTRQEQTKRRRLWKRRKIVTEFWYGNMECQCTIWGYNQLRRQVLLWQWNWILLCYAVRNPYQHKDKWMVDSGCTDHLSPFPDNFVSWENNTRKCKTANSNTMPIFGPGTIILRHHNGEHNRTLMLTGVYYAPHVLHHLLSVTALTKQGFTCTIGETTQIWDKSGNLMITAE